MKKNLQENIERARVACEKYLPDDEADNLIETMLASVKVVGRGSFVFGFVAGATVATLIAWLLI